MHELQVQVIQFCIPPVVVRTWIRVVALAMIAAICACAHESLPAAGLTGHLATRQRFNASVQLRPDRPGMLDALELCILEHGTATDSGALPAPRDLSAHADDGDIVVAIQGHTEAEVTSACKTMLERVRDANAAYTSKMSVLPARVAAMSGLALFDACTATTGTLAAEARALASIAAGDHAPVALKLEELSVVEEALTAATTRANDLEKAGLGPGHPEMLAVVRRRAWLEARRRDQAQAELAIIAPMARVPSGSACASTGRTALVEWARSAKPGDAVPSFSSIGLRLAALKLSVERGLLDQLSETRGTRHPEVVAAQVRVDRARALMAEALAVEATSADPGSRAAIQASLDLALRLQAEITGADGRAALVDGCSFTVVKDCAYVFSANLDDEPVGENGLLSAGDTLEIRVLGGFTVRRAIDVRGEIRLPLLGDVPAAGATARELGARIAEMLRDQQYYVAPATVVMVVGSHRRIRVFGAVRLPSFLAAKGPMSLAQAISYAGGFTPEADLHCVRVERQAGTSTGRIGCVDLEAIVEGRAEDFQLESGDVIFVKTRD